MAGYDDKDDAPDMDEGAPYYDGDKDEWIVPGEEDDDEPLDYDYSEDDEDESQQHGISPLPKISQPPFP